LIIGNPKSQHEIYITNLALYIEHQQRKQYQLEAHQNYCQKEEEKLSIWIYYTHEKNRKIEIGDSYLETTSWVEGNIGDQMSNLPNWLVEREFINRSIQKDSSSCRCCLLIISECKRVETCTLSGSLRVLLFINDLAISFSADDFPHNTSLQGVLLLLSIAEPKQQQQQQIKI